MSSCPIFFLRNLLLRRMWRLDRRIRSTTAIGRFRLFYSGRMRAGRPAVVRAQISIYDWQPRKVGGPVGTLESESRPGEVRARDWLCVDDDQGNRPTTLTSAEVNFATAPRSIGLRGLSCLSGSSFTEPFSSYLHARKEIRGRSAIHVHAEIFLARKCAVFSGFCFCFRAPRDIDATGSAKPDLYIVS